MSDGTGPEARSVRVTMIRCATLLIEWGDFRVLTDPWFSMRLWVIPCLRRPGLGVEALPPVDAVVVSHLHPDHWDAAAVARLRPAPRVVLFPPGGLARAGRGAAGWRELAPWNDVLVGEVRVFAVPGPHTGPGPEEVNYVLDFPGFGRVFFGGDARYDAGVLHEVARRFAPFRVAMLPVSGTLVLGRRTVMGPREAEAAADLLRADFVVPIHEGGVWLSLPPLSLHPGRSRDVQQRFERRGEGRRVRVLAEGESWTCPEAASEGGR